VRTQKDIYRCIDWSDAGTCDEVPVATDRTSELRRRATPEIDHGIDVEEVGGEQIREVVTENAPKNAIDGERHKGGARSSKEALRSSPLQSSLGNFEARRLAITTHAMLC